MTTRHPLPIALWLPALAVGAALILVFVWPTPYRYEDHDLEGFFPEYWRVNRFTGQTERQHHPWKEQRP